METLTNYWSGLTLRHRAFLIGGMAALAVVLLILTRVATAPSYELLYSGLEPTAAGEVVTALEARGVPYRVAGSSIEVPASERDGLRMALAGEGLPANGPQGYELLDALSGFGTTSQMFDAAYWRAREGELARTIISSPRIRAARVHIANPSANPFDAAQDVTASVALRPASGGLAPAHAQALRYLVASSVPGLTPDNVTVLDADSGLVLGVGETNSPATDAVDRSEKLRQNVERLLAARVGPGNAVVQVSVELENARETILERVIDPESRVVIAADTEERDDASTNSGANGVTVASNLPTGDADGASNQSSAQRSEMRESVTFDMSETQREIAREPGSIRRISVAVLLNGVQQVADDGRAQLAPRSEEELRALEALVQSAVGFDASRGDSVTVQSMVFDEAARPELVEAGLFENLQLDLGRLIQTLVLSGVALAIAFGLIRPMMRSATAAGPTADGAAALPYMSGRSPDALPGPDEDLPLGDDSAPVDLGNMPDFPQIAFPGLDNTFGSSDPLDQDPVTRLKRLIEEREEETVDILRSWMDEDEEGKVR